MADIVNLVTDVHLHCTNTATKVLMRDSIKRWANELSTPGKPMGSYFIEIDRKDIPQAERRRFCKQLLVEGRAGR